MSDMFSEILTTTLGIFLLSKSLCNPTPTVSFLLFLDMELFRWEQRLHKGLAKGDSWLNLNHNADFFANAKTAPDLTHSAVSLLS